MIATNRISNNFRCSPGVVASAWILLGTFPLIKRFSLLPGFLFVCFFGHTSGTKRGFTRSLHYSALLINPTRRVSMAFPVRYTPCEKRHQSFGLTTQEHPSMFCNTLTISPRLLWVPIAFARHTSASHPAAQPAISYQDGEGSVASHNERVKAFFFFPTGLQKLQFEPRKDTRAWCAWASLPAPPPLLTASCQL